MKLRLLALAAVFAVALIPAANGVARTQTTEPTEVIRINVTMTDLRMTLSDKSAERGAQVDFWVRNLGRKQHDFTFEASGAAPLSGLGFSTGPIKPRKTVVLQLYMDYRGDFTVRSSLKSDANKPRLKSTFKIV
jgi:hypothetical protein